MIKKYTVHKNQWFEVKKHLLNKNSIYYFLNKRPTVFIIAETNENEIIFIREYRYPINQTILQLPAGMVDGEYKINAAKRELFEETGYTASEWRRLGSFYVAAGHENTKIYVYLARKIKKSRGWLAKEDNVRSIEKFTMDQILDLIKLGKIKCGITLSSLCVYFSTFPRK